MWSGCLPREDFSVLCCSYLLNSLSKLFVFLLEASSRKSSQLLTSCSSVLSAFKTRPHNHHPHPEPQTIQKYFPLKKANKLPLAEHASKQQGQKGAAVHQPGPSASVCARGPNKVPTWASCAMMKICHTAYSTDH